MSPVLVVVTAEPKHRAVVAVVMRVTVGGSGAGFQSRMVPSCLLRGKGSPYCRRWLRALFPSRCGR